MSLAGPRRFATAAGQRRLKWRPRKDTPGSLSEFERDRQPISSPPFALTAKSGLDPFLTSQNGAQRVLPGDVWKEAVQEHRRVTGGLGSVAEAVQRGTDPSRSMVLWENTDAGFHR